jgi:hypothetical protein
MHVNMNITSSNAGKNMKAKTPINDIVGPVIAILSLDSDPPLYRYVNTFSITKN